jgi:hypothetical protein
VDLGEVPVVHMRVEKWRVSSLIDTGSAITAITPYLAFLTRKTWYPWLNGSVRVADGRTASPIGVMEVEIEFLGKCIFMPVAIMPGLSSDVIIGNDFNTPMNIVTERISILASSYKSHPQILITTGFGSRLF